MDVDVNFHLTILLPIVHWWGRKRGYYNSLQYNEPSPVEMMVAQCLNHQPQLFQHLLSFLTISHCSWISPASSKAKDSVSSDKQVLLHVLWNFDRSVLCDKIYLQVFISFTYISFSGLFSLDGWVCVCQGVVSIHTQVWRQEQAANLLTSPLLIKPNQPL